MSALRIDVGFFPAFKGGDTVLFRGEPAALCRLAGVFVELGQGGRSAVALGELPWMVEHSLRLRLCAGSNDEGMGGYAPEFEWHCKPSTWSTFAQQLESLAASTQGHVYLDTPNQRFGVVASCNEYPNLFSHTQSAA